MTIGVTKKGRRRGGHNTKKLMGFLARQKHAVDQRAVRLQSKGFLR
jgi:hypothetical protein